MLAALCGIGIIFFPIVAQLFQHLGLNLQTAILGEQIN